MKYPANPEALITDSQERRITREAEWDKVSLFLANKQWLKWNDKDSQWDRTRQTGTSKKRVTINRLLGYYRTGYAHLRMGIPGITVMPGTPSHDDLNKAQAAILAITYWWLSDDAKFKAQQGNRLLLKYGLYAVHVYYKPAKDESAESTNGSGCVTCKVHSPYDVFFEKDAPTADDSRWIAIRTYLTREQLKAMYPKKVKAINKLTTQTKTQSLYTFRRKRPDDRFEVFEFHWRDGRHAITVGKTYLEKSKFDPDYFPVETINYTEFDDDPLGMGMMEPLLEAQWSYNNTRTRAIRNEDKIGNAKILVPRGSGIRPSDWNDTDGDVIQFNAAKGKPIFWAPQPALAMQADNAARLQAEMDDLAGIPAVTRGKQVPGGRSASVIDSLSDNALQGMKMTEDNIERGWERIFRVVLHLMKKYYSKRKMMRAFDHFGKAMFKSIKGTDLSDTPEVFISASTLFQRGAEARSQQILEMVQAGIMPPEGAMELMHLGLGPDPKAMERIQSIHHAQELLDGILNNHPIELDISDDIATIARVFKEYQRSDEHREQPEEIQKYLSNTLAAIATHGQPDEMYQQAARLSKIWPRQSPQNPANVQATQGQAGKVQVANEGNLLANDASDVHAEEARMARRQETSPINRRM